MWTNLIALLEPDIDDDLSLIGRMEPFHVQDLAAMRTIKALVVGVLPR